MTGCAHVWGHAEDDGPTPLHCLRCGVPWPGEQLPDGPTARRRRAASPELVEPKQGG